jgi:single-strand DNA-binding protein
LSFAYAKKLTEHPQNYVFGDNINLFRLIFLTDYLRSYFMSLNKVQIIGYAGADPEIRFLPTSGDAVAQLSIATTERYKDRTTGETKEITEWHRVNFFGGLAKVVGDYLKKGSHVYVEGRLRTRKFTDKEGIERYSTEIRADKLDMLDRKGAQSGANPAVGTPDGMDDDIPF